MNERTATHVANGLLLLGAGALAYLVLRDPQRRRTVFRLTRAAIAGPLAASLTRELKTAWEESGPRSIMAK